MNIKKATKETAHLIDKTNLPDEHPEFGKDHLHYMVKVIQDGEVTGEKAHRWLGWLQACMCFGNGATLKELASINIESKEEIR